MSCSITEGVQKLRIAKKQYWRMELAEFSYTIRYWEGVDNTVPDSFTRAYCAAAATKLEDIHAQLCHPGVTCFLHVVETKNLPFTTQDVRHVCSNCQVCAELKPNFYQSQNIKLTKATRPMERFSIDIKGLCHLHQRTSTF